LEKLGHTLCIGITKNKVIIFQSLPGFGTSLEPLAAR